MLALISAGLASHPHKVVQAEERQPTCQLDPDTPYPHETAGTIEEIEAKLGDDELRGSLFFSFLHTISGESGAKRIVA